MIQKTDFAWGYWFGQFYLDQGTCPQFLFYKLFYDTGYPDPHFRELNQQIHLVHFEAMQRGNFILGRLAV